MTDTKKNDDRIAIVDIDDYHVLSVFLGKPSMDMQSRDGHGKMTAAQAFHLLYQP